MTGSGVSQEVQNDLTTGAADLEWSTRVPAGDVDNLTSPAWDARYGVFPIAGDTGPYVVFNVLSPNNNGALGNVKVRRALEYAINKVAIGNLFGGRSLTEPLNQVIGPGAEGYVPFNDYLTKDNEGDPGKCKSLLAAVGYPTGLTLTDIYKAYLTLPLQVFEEVKADFGKCGVNVVAPAVSTDTATFGDEVFSSDAVLKAGKWDFTSALGWGPDGGGPRNGRAILPDLFDDALADTFGYHDSAVNSLVTEAESALTLKQATSAWHQADERVMAVAAFIPIQTQLVPLFRSARVHNAIFSNAGWTYDITQVWLSSEAEEQ